MKTIYYYESARTLTPCRFEAESDTEAMERFEGRDDEFVLYRKNDTTLDGRPFVTLINNFR
jgi:hypothetical protein